MSIDTQIKEIESLLKRQKEEIKILLVRKGELETENSKLNKEFSEGLGRKRKLEADLKALQSDLDNIKTRIDQELSIARENLNKESAKISSKLKDFEETEREQKANKNMLLVKESELIAEKGRIKSDLQLLSSIITKKIAECIEDLSQTEL